MSQPRVLAINDINKLAGNIDCPSCGNRILLLNINKSYYCPNCAVPISFEVNKKTTPNRKLFSTFRSFTLFFDKWTIVYSIIYPFILSIIPLLCIINNKNGTYLFDYDSFQEFTSIALVILYGFSIIFAVWKSLSNIIGMLAIWSIVIVVLMLFGIPPQVSISVIGFFFAAIFIMVRINFILKNWRAVVAGILLLTSPLIPLLYLNSPSVQFLFLNSEVSSKVNLFIILFIYYALVSNSCILWLCKNSYTSKQAVIFIGTTPLIIAMLVLPFLNKIGIDIDGIDDIDTGKTVDHQSSIEGESIAENPAASSVQGEKAVFDIPEVQNVQEIIPGQSSGVPHDVISEYYIKSEIILEPQLQPIINLKNVEVDYYASQQSPDTCAIASQRMILADQTGVDYSETYLLKYAEKCGYYTQGQGTPLDLTGQLLKDAGLEVIEADSVSLEQIDLALQNNYSVSENLDPNEYIDPKYDNAGNPVELPDKIGHNVKIVSINKDLSGAYVSVVIDDPVVGPHIEIPINDYINSRNDFGHTVFAKKII